MLKWIARDYAATSSPSGGKVARQARPLDLSSRLPGRICKVEKPLDCLEEDIELRQQ